MGENVTGLILAGGKSSRFGSDKALALLRGQSLLERAATTLTPWASEVIISAAAGSPVEIEADRLGFSVVPDQTDIISGPLAGILAGLEWSARSDAKWMFSLPCDVVNLPRDAFSRLLSRAAAANGAYAVTSQGPQSLCAIWPVKAKDTLRSTLGSQKHPPVRDFANLLGAEPVRFDGDGAFLNINTQGDLAAAEKALSP
jgi:molybdopterin-guanine dinucleotide biosynthesis protein A